LIIKVSNSGRKPSKKQKEKQKAAWAEHCKKYGLDQGKENKKDVRYRINKFGEFERV
jgi:hypothetical protein